MASASSGSISRDRLRRIGFARSAAGRARSKSISLAVPAFPQTPSHGFTRFAISDGRHNGVRFRLHADACGVETQRELTLVFEGILKE